MKFLPLLSAALVLVGCGDSPTTTKAATKAEPEAVQTTVPVETLRASYDATKKAYLAAKSDTTEKPYVHATVAYATAVMAGDGKPKEKYPMALVLYDEALAVDPGNEEATTNKQLILDIYKSMGKEPPKK